jgi:arsenate reductase-like glutaredoxin family protein
VTDSRRRTEVQIFGLKKSADTRKALRFFSERRIKAHFVDLAERELAPAELRRFTTKFGTQALIDRQGTRYAELGLGVSARADEWWELRLVEDPMLINIPLVRFHNHLSVGFAEREWRQWIDS